MAVILNTTAGTLVNTPDSVALSITGDLDVRIHCTPTSWSPGAGVQTTASKGGFTGSTTSWWTNIGSTGIPQFAWSSTGASGNTKIKNATASVPFSAGAPGWIGVTLDVDNGVGGNDLKFWTSMATVPPADITTWSQLGTTVTTAGVTSIFDNAAALIIGERDTGGTTDHFIGSIYEVQVRNGINGTVVANPNFDAAPWVNGDVTPTARADGSGNTWTLQGSAIIADIPEPPPPPPPPPSPLPPVVSQPILLDDSVGRLGCGTHTAIITVPCGATIAVLEGITKIEYGRDLDVMSEATVTLHIGGDQNTACAAELADVWPWCHDLHIYRNGETVWTGPIQQITYARDNIVIKAKDHLAWTDVMQLNFDYSLTGGTGSAVDIATTAYDLFTHSNAATEDEDILDCTLYNEPVIFPTGITGDRYLPNYTKSIYEWWTQDFVTSGMELAVISGQLFLGDIGNNVPTLGTLRDTDFIGELEVIKDGDLQGNRFYVTYDGDGGNVPPGVPPFHTHVPAESETSDLYCFHRLERLITDSGALDLASAQLTADAYVLARAVTPITINVPDGSQLSPGTPVTIKQLIPGCHLNISVTVGSFATEQTFRLQGLKVVDDENGEKIQVTVRSLGEG